MKLLAISQDVLLCYTRGMSSVARIIVLGYPHPITQRGNLRTSIIQVFVVVAAFMYAASLYAAGLPQLPSGPAGAGKFGAYYTTLKYEDSWDAPWRIGDHADVVVRFDTGGHTFVFWRGTSYIPCWVTDTGIWYTNEFVERRGADSPNTRGCCEPMSDKQCRYSHVRIIENTDARVVVHWRYAPVDVQYEHPFLDPDTGWSDWVDEYYYLYPDAVGVRKITLHTSAPEKWTEWHEAIVLNQPGTMPEDNIALGALSVATMEGKSTTYTWNEQGAPEFDPALSDANILKVNLKGTRNPFAIIPSGKQSREFVITPYKGHGKGSFFNFWNHWPVSQAASDTTLADSAERASHSSLAHMAHGGARHWPYYAEGDTWRTKVMLHGMTDQEVTALVPLAKSWENAPALQLEGKGYSTTGYDQAERAYQFKKEAEKLTPLSFSINADQEHPLVNPAFVIKNWGDASGISVTLNGKELEPGTAFRYGYHHTLEGTALIVWMHAETANNVAISIDLSQARTGAG